MTTLNVTLSGTLQTELAQPGVWAYAIWFDKATTTPQITDLVNNGSILNNGSTGIFLPNGSVDGGKVYFIVQSQATSQPFNLSTLITSQSAINWQNAAAWDFRYDSFEVTLLNGSADAGNLSSVNGYGLPMGVVVPYSNGTTASVGYGVSGTSIVNDITNINTANTYAFDYTSGPLSGDFRMALSPTEDIAITQSDTTVTPVFSPNDWSGYVQSLETAAVAQQITLTGQFNGAADANNVWHNGGYFAYQLQWDATKQVFWLAPLANSQIQGFIQLTPSDLENSIYSTLGNAEIFNSETDTTPYSSQFFSEPMNTGLNNQWGKVLSELLTGFTGGFYGESGKSPNPAVTGTVDLNQNSNWDPSYAFGQNLVSPPPTTYQTSDPYSQIFYDHSNSYGSGYSDALMSQYSVGGPLINVYDPGITANVANIDLTIYADGETPNPVTAQGYTVPVIYNYIAAPAGGYTIPDTVGAPNISLSFASAVADSTGIVLTGTETVILNVLSAYSGSTPIWNSITLDGANAGTLGLWQLWQISGSNGNYTVQASPNSEPTGSMLIGGLPFAQTGTSWYQIIVAGKTFNLYTETSGGAFLNPNYQGQAGDQAIDGLATLTMPQPPAGNAQPQTWTTFTVNFATGDTVAFGPDDIVLNLTNAGSIIPDAPVAGTINGGSFTALAGQSSPTTNTITATAGNIAFGWTGDNPNATVGGGTSWAASYTNKIDAGDVALITITPSIGTAITTTATADIDGMWTSGTVDLGVGTYDVTMQAFLPTDTAYANPVTGTSQILEMTLQAPCFLAGTRIRTPSGDIAVERLAEGDLVLTERGEAKPITWVGKGKVLATPGRRSAATPVIVRKGALADNVPDRDLHVTKGHAFYLDAALIPVEFLVNHRSIVWDDRAQEVEIYHLELDTHDVLLANDAPAESYRDDGNRWLFHNGNSGWGQPEKPPFAPVLTGGPLVDAVWRRLLQRSAQRLHVATTADPDLHLLVDGSRVDGRVTGNGIYSFRLPARPDSVRIVSRAAAQDELGVARDPRLLGVALRRMALWRGRHVQVLEAEDAALQQGFHAFEAENGFRWTNGNALLPASLLDGADAGALLELHVACTARYWTAEQAVQAAA